MRRSGYLVILIVIAGCGVTAPRHGGRATRSLPPAARTVSVSSFLAEDRSSDNPVAGMACDRANYVPCDRFGLGVRLGKPAIRVLASVGQERFVMKMGGFGGSGPKYWEGYATRVGLSSSGPFRVTPDRGLHYWAGLHPLTVRVSITAVFRNGRKAHGIVPVDVHPGWG